MLQRLLRNPGWLVPISCLAIACEPDPRTLPSRQRAPEPPIHFDSAVVRIETPTDTFPLGVEIAETPEQRARGLMGRTRLAEDAGMLFLYPEPQEPDAGFWMYRTLIPLDIAFLDEASRILAIRTMEPCTSPNPQLCRTYTPGVSYTSALEVNRGYFERRDIGTGDRVVLEGAADPDSRQGR